MQFQTFEVKTEEKKQQDLEEIKQLREKARKQKFFYQQDVIEQMKDKEIDSLLQQLKEVELQGKKRLEEQRKKHELRMEKQQKINEYQVDRKVENIPIDGDIQNGSRVFMKMCASCHQLSVNSAGKKRTGPALGLIFNKQSGTDNYYDHYSYSLIQSNFLWNKLNLFKFLNSPQSFLPDNKCNINKNIGIKDPNDIADLIKFFKVYAQELKINIKIKSENAFGKDFVDKEIRAQLKSDQNNQY